MAGVLERRERKQFLDDTTTLTCTITTHRMEQSGKQSHAAYVIHVQRGPNPDDGWDVSHRYNDFYTLHQFLQASNFPLTIPAKTMLKKTDRQFLLERQQGLQTFLNQVMAEPVLYRHLEVKKFLDPNNYSASFHEDALQNVSMFFRSQPTWTVVEPLIDIGWRIRKQYYLIASKTNPKLPKHMLSWCEPGPDSSLGEKEMEACFKVLTELKHPHILSPILANYTGGGMMTVREFVPNGSLRDAIRGQQPRLSVLQKYGQPSRSRALNPADIAKYGRQVLDALMFLSEKGFVLGQVHAGNVLLKDGICKLVDIENSLLGVPSLHRRHLIDIRRIHSHEAETVYSFGHMLYEMCMGEELKTAVMDTMPQALPAALVPILEKILTAKGIKDSFPTLSNLLDNPFFSTVHVPPQDGKPTMKVGSKLREVLREHISKMELRLHEEQKKVSQFRRMSKAHESLMSEEEKRKRRKLRKKQMSLQETDTQEYYPTTTSLPRQNTIGTSGVTASNSVRSKANSAPPPSQNSTPTQRPTSSSTSAVSKTKKSSATPKAPPPPSSDPAPQADRPPPPPSGERGALLSSIQGFAKGKLKKSKTNDRSAPKL